MIHSLRKRSTAVFLTLILGFQLFGNTPIASAAAIGQTLSSPEAGWQRINDDNPFFIYSVGSTVFNNGDNIAFWKGGVESLKGSGTVKFAFYGTKLRIIAQPYVDRSSSVNVTIDGTDMGNYSAYSSSGTSQALLYEKTGLSLDRHIITITNKTANYFFWDALDIDPSGYMTGITPDPTLMLLQGLNSLKSQLNVVNYDQSRTLKVSELIPFGYSSAVSVK